VWEETYLKLLLLYADKVGFAQSFCVPSFPSSRDLPSLPGAIMYAFVCTATLTLYLVSSFNTIMGITGTSLEDGHDDDGNPISADDKEADEYGKFLKIVLPSMIFLAILAAGGVALRWFLQIGSRGRLGALMAFAQKHPPKRDHSKPIGYTWYRELIRVSVYGGAVFVTFIPVVMANDVPLTAGIQIGLLVLILMEPLMNINESIWTSTAISDAQVVITAGMQGQCVFSEGDSNSIAVNLTALAQLKWDPSALKMKETVSQVAKKNKTYTFQVFDLSTGYYTSVNLEKMTKLKADEGSVANAVMQELRKNMRAEFVQF